MMTPEEKAQQRASESHDFDASKDEMLLNAAAQFPMLTRAGGAAHWIGRMLGQSGQNIVGRLKGEGPKNDLKSFKPTEKEAYAMVQPSSDPELYLAKARARQQRITNIATALSLPVMFAIAKGAVGPAAAGAMTTVSPAAATGRTGINALMKA
jgi:hypothetical protein